MMRFPGRRGTADQIDFHLYPLSFFETVSLYEPRLAGHFTEARASFQKNLDLPPSTLLESAPSDMETLYSFWERYLFTGGFITAINHYAKEKKVSKAVYRTYLQWVLGDLAKRGKREESARDLFGALIDRLASQITWHGLTSSTTIEHHQTIADYAALLERMDVLFVLQAFREDKMRGSPKKARKVHFFDPFIFHAIHAWVKYANDPFALASQIFEEKGKTLTALIEGTAAELARRRARTFYIKGETEVDLVLAEKEKFLPIEIKWSPLPKESDLRQLLKYKNGIVATRGRTIGRINGATILPTPLLALLLA